MSELSQPVASNAHRQIINEAVERSFHDPAYFCRFFLSHWFPSAIPPFHLGLMALITQKVAFLDEYPDAHDFLLNHFKYSADPADPDGEPIPAFVLDSNNRICLVAGKPNQNWIVPRGFSKTTLTKAANLYLLLTDATTFLVLISETSTHSETQLHDIRSELEANAYLREGYGNQVPTRADNKPWTGTEIHLLNGAIAVAKGRGGQVRGLTHQGKRPNIIMLDDIEDEEAVATDGQRAKTVNWFYASVVPAGQIMHGSIGEDWAQETLRIINLGTLLATECMVTTLARDESFSTVRFGAKLDDGSMLWPYKLPLEEYEKLRTRYQRSGQLGHFAREYDSTIRVDEDALFPSFFHYVPVLPSDLIQRAQALDPAISDKPTADEAAIVVGGRHRDTGEFWFLDEWGGTGKSPTALLDQFFKFQRDYRTHKNGIEAVAYQAALLHLAREQMLRTGQTFIIEAIKPGSGLTKENRIEGTLSPRYSNNFIYHRKPLPKLEANLLDWPNGRKDFADAAAMVLNLLGETVGVVLEGNRRPAAVDRSLPAPLPRIGNYYVRGASARPNPGSNPRYGG